MCSATITWPSLRSALAFARRACTSEEDANVFIAAASVWAAGAWGSACEAAGVTAKGAAGCPARATMAAISARTILSPRVRIYSSSYRDFRCDLPDGHTYTPGGLPGELKMIFAAYSSISDTDNRWKLICNRVEMVYE